MTANEIILLIVISVLLIGIFLLYAKMILIWRDAMLEQSKRWGELHEELHKKIVSLYELTNTPPKK